MSKKQQINWRRVWRQFREWYDKVTARSGGWNFAAPSWDSQQRKIRELVNKELSAND